jgi:hypothetical protein
LSAGSPARALLVDLDQWVSTGQRPPGNRVPSFASNTLAPSLPQSGVGFPNIPNPSSTLPATPVVAYNGIHQTGDLWGFGALFDQGILSLLPPRLLGTP